MSSGSVVSSANAFSNNRDHDNLMEQLYKIHFNLAPIHFILVGAFRW